MLAQRVAQQFADGLSVEQVYLELLGEGETVAQIAEAVSAAQRRAAGAGMQSRVVRVVIGIGTALVAAGVFSFVAANWEAMADWSRIAVIIAGMVMFSGSGLFVRDRLEYRITGEALLLLGSTVFGAGVFLVAQMYNLRGNWPDGMVWWLLGTLLAAGAARSMPLVWLSVVLGLIAAFAYPIGLLGDSPLLNPYVLSSPIMIALGAAAALAAGIMLRARVPERFKDRW